MTEQNKNGQPIVSSTVDGIQNTPTTGPNHMSFGDHPHLHHPHTSPKAEPVVVEPVVAMPEGATYIVQPPPLAPRGPMGTYRPHGPCHRGIGPIHTGRGGGISHPHRGLADRLKQGHNNAKMLDAKRNQDNGIKR